MYNLNVQLAASANLSVENSCTTPKTPEILNSLIAMTNPFDYQNGSQAGNMGSGGNMASPRTASSPPDTSAASPTFAVPATPPSVQHTCSQLIKEGLKVTIQRKRQISGRDTIIVEPKACKREEIGSRTPEDEERRRRRRERNKIAATKCRLKKREKTGILVQESEILENQNLELKSQIQELENQRRRLMDMLSMHSPTCVKNCHYAASPTSVAQATSATNAPSYCNGMDTSASNNYPYSGSCNFAYSGMESGCVAL